MIQYYHNQAGTPDTIQRRNMAFTVIINIYTLKDSSHKRSICNESDYSLKGNAN